ncbi:unnamed protein product [Closterium sp. NIES-53]
MLSSPYKHTLVRYPLSASSTLALPSTSRKPLPPPRCSNPPPLPLPLSNTPPSGTASPPPTLPSPPSPPPGAPSSPLSFRPSSIPFSPCDTPAAPPFPPCPRTQGSSCAKRKASTMRRRAWMFCRARFSADVPPSSWEDGVGS